MMEVRLYQFIGVNEGFVYFVDEGFLYFVDEGYLYFVNMMVLTSHKPRDITFNNNLLNC